MKPVGVTLGWSGHPQLEYEKSNGTRGWILPYEWELLSKKEYYPDGRGSWPRDPKTREKLETNERSHLVKQAKLFRGTEVERPIGEPGGMFLNYAGPSVQDSAGLFDSPDERSPDAVEPMRNSAKVLRENRIG